MEQRLVIGEITKPQGIRGEVKIKPYTDNPERFKKLKNVYIDSVNYSVMQARVLSDAVFLILKGVADRNSAEILRGKMLEIDRLDAVELDDGKYFIVDVLGSKLTTENDQILGVVTDINTSGKQDVYTVKNDSGKLMIFPLLKDVLKCIDVENKKVVVFEKRFKEICLYED